SPWFFNFTLHLTGFLNKRQFQDYFYKSDPFLAGIYSLFTGLFGSSIYPWNYVFIIFFTGLFISLFISLFNLWKSKSGFHAKEKNNSTGFNVIVIFTVILFCLLIILTMFTGILKSQLFML